MTQVQAARGAARQAGVPEHVVTGVRLRVKPPDDAAEGFQGKGNAGRDSADGQEVSGKSTGSSTNDCPDRDDAAIISAAHSIEPARQLSSPSGEDTTNMDFVEKPGNAARAGEGRRQQRYHLVAVVVHHGGPESGHYTTFRCVGARRQWFLTSDVEVWPVAEGVVMGSEATLLLYERDTVQIQ